MIQDKGVAGDAKVVATWRVVLCVGEDAPTGK